MRLFHLFFLICVLFLSCSADEYDYFEEEIPEKSTFYQEHIVCHRGYWKEPNLPSNSLSAFKIGLTQNYYGLECDVRQTSDGVIVICHDNTFGGLEISKNDYNTLSRYFLSNGEILPCLEDFLIALKSSSTKSNMMIEIKSGSVEKVVELVEQYSVRDKCYFSSMSLNTCKSLVSLGYGNVTSYLYGNLTPEKVKELGIGGISYKNTIYHENPDYIERCSKLNIRCTIWTINTKSDIKKYIDQGYYVVTDTPYFFK